MKRDNDLVRRLMLAAEAVPAGRHVFGTELMSEGDDFQVVAEHLHLLVDQGFLKGQRDSVISEDPSPERILITSISWKGHEFLDAIRDDTIWEKTKDRVGKVGGSVSLSTLTEVAAAIAKSMMGL